MFQSIISNKVKCLAFMVLTATCGGCTKQKSPESNPSTIFVFNALEGGVSVRANLSGVHPVKYFTALHLLNRSRIALFSGQPVQPIAFYAQADTMPGDAPVWSDNLELERGKSYSLFLVTGDKGGEGIFMKDNIPAPQKDSVTYLRFANMSNGAAISVNIKGQPNGSLINSLNWKEVSPFLSIPINKSISSIVFEVRNAATGNLIAEHISNDVNVYQWTNSYLHVPWTLVLTGKPGGTGGDLQRLTQLNFE